MDLENLKKLKIFLGVQENAVESVIQQAKKEFFPAERLIIYEGERIDNKGYIVLSGEVKISLKKIEIAHLGVGEIFGEIGLIIGEKRKATVHAAVDTEVLVIDFDELMTLIDNDENNINKEVIRRMQANLLLEDEKQ